MEKQVNRAHTTTRLLIFVSAALLIGLACLVPGLDSSNTTTPNQDAIDAQIEATVQAAVDEEGSAAAMAGATEPITSQDSNLLPQDLLIPELVITEDTVIQSFNTRRLSFAEVTALIDTEVQGDETGSFEPDEGNPPPYNQSMFMSSVVGSMSEIGFEDLCAPRVIKADLVPEIDGAEQYMMVSLLDCNGINYVTPVKHQVGGSCGTFAETAAMEIQLARFILPQEERPVTVYHPIDDFSPINLSEGSRLYSAFISPDSAPVITAPENRTWFGTTLDQYFPDSEVTPYAPWDDKTAIALERQYGSFSDYCLDMEDTGLEETHQSFADLTRCLFDIAKKERYIFVDYNEADRNSLGNLRDFETIEANTMYALSLGIPVVIKGAWWYWDFNNSVLVDQDTSTGAQIANSYQFLLLQPRPEADYEHDGSGNVITPHQVEDSSSHVVVIVGYLHGDQGNDFWIIKNSHGEREPNSNKDTFLLVRMPSTSGAADQPNSTRRNFSIASFYTQGDLSFFQMSPQTQTVDQVLATENSSLALNDQDLDGIIDLYDNCPTLENSNQEDRDLDFVGDACDPCPLVYDRYQSKSNTNLVTLDYDGDGVPLLCDYDGTLSTKQGAGFLTYANGQFNLDSEIVPFLGWHMDWYFDPGDEFLGSGRLLDDQRDAVLVRNSGALGVIYLSGDTIRSRLSLKRWFDSEKDHIIHWPLIPEDQVAGIGNVFPEGEGQPLRDEVLLFHFAKGLDVINVGPNADWQELALVQTGDAFGNWELDYSTQVGPLGDLSGNGYQEILMQSSSGMIALTVDDSGNLTDFFTVPVDTWLGEWHYGYYGPFGDQLVGTGNFDGVGADEIVIRSEWGFGILHHMRRLTSRVMVPNGTWMGSWRYDQADQILGIGDFNLDGKTDILLRSDFGIGAVTLDSANQAFETIFMIQFQHRIGDWLLETTDKIIHTADFNGDGGDDILIRKHNAFTVLSYSLGSNDLYPIRIYTDRDWAGEWLFRNENVFAAFGEFSTPGKTSILVQSSLLGAD
jgi:hypothetical protein